MSTNPLPADPYLILGVPKDATIAIIKSAHRKLVLTCHPDKFLDEAVKAQKTEEFQRVQKAYELLTDDKERELYDAKVRLAELRSERAREWVGATKRPEPTAYSPRPTAERSWTTQPIYEEIRPRTTRFHEEPRSTEPRPADPRPSPRYEDYRPRAKDYDEYDDFVPAQTTSKKAGTTGTRATETRQEAPSSRAKDRWKQAASKVTEKSKEKEYEDRRKSRDKGRRDDGQTKRAHIRIPLNEGGSGSETESDVESFMAPSHVYPRSERPRSYEEDKHRSRRKHESRPSSPDRETRETHNFKSAAEYIAKSSGKGSADPHSRRRPSLSRSQTTGHNQVPPPPPPPPPPVPLVDDVIRSSAKRPPALTRPSKSSKRDVPEIVEPRRRDHHHDDDLRRPHLSTASTSPSSLKPPRSSTLQSHGSEKARTSIRRSATSPLAQMSQPHKSSKLRDNHDSGNSSSGTPEVSSPRTTKTAYKIHEIDSDSDSGQPRYVVIDPDSRRHAKETSPRNLPYRSERTSSSLRHGPARSQTLDDGAPHRPGGTSHRSSTERPGVLFGELPRGSPEHRSQYFDVKHSPRYGKHDINYTDYPQRSSPTEKNFKTDHRDAYPGHERRGSMPIRTRAQEV